MQGVTALQRCSRVLSCIYSFLFTITNPELKMVIKVVVFLLEFMMLV